PWMGWLTAELAVDRVAYIPTQNELLRATLLVALVRAGASVRIPPGDWRMQNEEEIRRAGEEVLGLSALWETAGLEQQELERRWSIIQEALAKAVEEERSVEVERVRQEDLDPRKAQEFTEAVEAS